MLNLIGMTMLDFIILTLGTALVSWLVLGGLFLAYPTMQRLKRDHIDEIGWVLIVPAYLWFVIGGLADIAFNLTVGTFIFREFPREFLFTSRLSRHWRGGSEKMRDRAAPWVRRVNLIDPGHI